MVRPGRGTLGARSESFRVAVTQGDQGGGSRASVSAGRGGVSAFPAESPMKAEPILCSAAASKTTGINNKSTSG